MWHDNDVITVQRFVERPLRVAQHLAGGESEGTYMEACLIISGLMSGIASYLWPGQGIDRARFVETWVRFAAPTHPEALRVSLPLLRHTLYSESEADARRLGAARTGMFGLGYGNRIVVSEEIDGDENEMLSICPSLQRALVRRHAYPAVFYELVRCQLSHEYQMDGGVTAYPMTGKSDPRVSYACTPRYMHMPDGEVIDASTREIHFHIEWLVQVTQAIARNVDAHATNGRLQVPTAWWIRG